ncbi:MAG: SRPBCC domain-containing protein [Phycisphaerales bacterium JB064]
MSTHAPTASLSNRQITVSRVLAAPAPLVFEAFTDPAHVSNWWGPHGFRTTTSEHDLRVGGVWRFVMHGPDGIDYPNLVKYTEVDRPRRLAYEQSGDRPDEKVSFEAEVNFEALGDSTRVTLCLTFPDAQQRDGAVAFGAVEGGTQTLQRLGARLTALVAENHQVSISRRFNAPLDLIWRALTEPDMLARWFVPMECELLSQEMDVRVGGQIHESMRCKGTTHTFSGRFTAIEPKNRIAFTHQWDEPGSPETLVTIELHAAGLQTDLTLVQTGLASADSALSHAGGWGSCLTSLDSRLASM